MERYFFYVFMAIEGSWNSDDKHCAQAWLHEVFFKTSEKWVFLTFLLDIVEFFQN